MTIFPFIEFIFTSILLKSFISLLTFIWLVCLIESPTLTNGFIIVIIFLRIWRVISHVVVISRLIVILSEVIGTSINRSILIGPVSHWRIVFNYVRLHFISSQFLSQRRVLNSFWSWSTVTSMPSVLVSIIISIPILMNRSFLIDKYVSDKAFIFLFQIKNCNVIVEKYWPQMKLFTVLKYLP